MGGHGYLIEDLWMVFTMYYDSPGQSNPGHQKKEEIFSLLGRKEKYIGPLRVEITQFEPYKFRNFVTDLFKK